MGDMRGKLSSHHSLTLCGDGDVSVTPGKWLRSRDVSLIYELRKVKSEGCSGSHLYNKDTITSSTKTTMTIIIMSARVKYLLVISKP